MRLYGGKFLRNTLAKQIDQRTESRDAILWDVFPETRQARVKIQGSATLIVANFPANWAGLPSWLKPGNAVRISHTGGNRGRVELSGDGMLIPTPMPNDAPFVGATSPDAIISGLSVTPGQGMSVMVSAGVVRMGGGVASVGGGVTMAAASEFTMGDGGEMGLAATIAIAAAPTGLEFRFDAIVIGPDMVIDYVQGVAGVSPGKPAIANDHLLITYVLVPAEHTQMVASDFKKEFTAPFASVVGMVIANKDMEWGVDYDTTITLTLYDQYGRPLAPPAGQQWKFYVEKINGTGNFTNSLGMTDYALTEYSSTAVGVVTYHRSMTSGEESPIIRAYLVDPGYSNPIVGGNAVWDVITLRDIDGNIM